MLLLSQLLLNSNLNPNSHCSYKSNRVETFLFLINVKHVPANPIPVTKTNEASGAWALVKKKQTKILCGKKHHNICNSI